MFRRNLMARREVLKSVFGGLLLAPFLRQRELQAQQTTPKRIILLFTPNSQPPEWWPTGIGSDFALQEPLLDFAGFEKDMLFVRQLNHSWSRDNHHEAGMTQLFTGGEFYDEVSRYSTHPSIEQVLLQNTDLRGGTPRDCVHLCIDSGGTDVRHVISYSGANQPIRNEYDPAVAFTNVFDGIDFSGNMTSTPTPTHDPIAAPELDSRIHQINMDQVRYLQRFLGQDERERLDVHLESLRDLQLQIESGTENAAPPRRADCQPTDTAKWTFNTGDDDNVKVWAKMQADLIVNSFTCDVTRAAVMQYGRSGGGHDGLLGLEDSWHISVAHESATDDSIALGEEHITTRAAFIRFSRFWGSQIAYLVKRLADLPEGDGRMLDNTLLYWGVESGTNHSHSPVDMQYLLIGGRNLGFQVGQHLQLDSPQLANKLHTAVMQGFGYDAPGFGVEDNCGALSGIVG